MKKLTLLCTVLITAATQACSAAPTSTAEQQSHSTRPNTFMINSYQAGSTTEIDDLKVIDLDSGEVVYENTFSAPIPVDSSIILLKSPERSLEAKACCT